MTEKQNETKPIEKKTKPIERKPVQWPLMQEEVEAMISEWMKDKHGVTGHDWGNNVPKGIIMVSFIPGTK